MTLDDTIVKSRDLARLCRPSLPAVADEQEQLASWLEQLKAGPNAGIGISICILTYNVLFYNKLALKQIRELTRLVNYEILVFDNGSTDGSQEWLTQQADVRLFCHKPPGQAFRHGSALDFLAKQVKYPIICTLCSDAFPTAMEWWTPAMYLSDEVYLCGVERGYGRITQNYVCPSYLFGWTNWLRNHTFRDDWPNADTGEWLTKDCEKEGKKVKMWKKLMVDFGNHLPKKDCDYSGLCWHTWQTGRVQSIPGISGGEVPPDYHSFVVEYLRKKYSLNF